MIERIILVVLFVLFIFAVGRMVIAPQKARSVNTYSVHNYLTLPHASRVVEVVGAVASTGAMVEVDDNMRVVDVIQVAGGLTNIADVSQLDLAMMITKKNLPTESIYIPFKNDIPDSAVPFYHPPNEYLASAGKGSININITTVDELIAATGIPTKTAQNIIQYRDEKGKIRSLDELRKIEGVTPDVMYRLKKKVIL